MYNPLEVLIIICGERSGRLTRISHAKQTSQWFLLLALLYKNLPGMPVVLHILSNDGLNRIPKRYLGFAIINANQRMNGIIQNATGYFYIQHFQFGINSDCLFQYGALVSRMRSKQINACNPITGKVPVIRIDFF